MPEISDSDRENIAQQILEGYTSGIFLDGEGNRISWEIEINKFE